MAENFEKEKISNFEVMKTPEIVVQDEPGAQLLSLILKDQKPDWAEGIDEEALYNLALTYKHPERTEAALETLAKYKSYIDNPQELQKKILKALEKAKGPKIDTEQDKKTRLENLETTKQRIERIIEFFRPDAITTPIKRISLMPTDQFSQKDSGTAFPFGEELVLKTHIENPDNLDHEFLHSVINPIVEKLSQQLTDEQKEKVVQLASEKLKQDYGEKYFSLLCEELIRTYNDVFKKGERPQTYEDFLQKISGISEGQFQEFLAQSESLRTRCDELEIKTIENLRSKSQEYFERFERNCLRDLIFELYQEYASRPDKNENFEQFLTFKISSI